MENFRATFVRLCVALLSVYCSVYCERCNVHIVLQGATGDLAKKYLWSAIFDNYIAQLRSDSGFRFISVTASSREPVSKGDDILADLANTLKCPQPTEIPEQCSALKTRFSDIVAYHQLKSKGDYSLLASKHQALDEACATCCVGKLFYLSVPPHAYSSIAEHIHNHLRPMGNGSNWIRVLFEKPFGSDLNSAVALHNKLAQYLKEDEIYRIDHYLGKSGVKQILPFRNLNEEQLRGYWNNDHISHMEAVIQEKLDCSGRTKFYDRYGVFRDVFQNHLTEMIALVAMELHTSGEDSSKMKFLESLFPPRLYSTVLGQYEGYISHLISDGVQQNARNISHTPTYASVVLFSRAPQWLGVPFFLTSGKCLGQRSSYIKVVFKSSLVSSHHFTGSNCNPELVFVIQDDRFELPGILISEHFADLILVAGSNHWKTDITTASDLICGHYAYLNINNISSTNANAYTGLLLSALLGIKENFVSTERLLEHWKIWSPLLEEIDMAAPHIQLYNENTLELLRYKRIGSKLQYIQLSSGTEEAAPTSEGISSLVQSNVVVGTKFSLADKLTLKLKNLVSQALDDGVTFHLALPGGTSPELFYQNMVMERNNFPWHSIHIWQVDERCVPYYSSDSNLRNIDYNFLQLVPIPRSNIHPMVDYHGNCRNADILYQAELSQHALDLVVLGLGKDGHVASLFSNIHYNESNILVSYVKLQEFHLVETKERMTLTFNAILQSKHIVVLAVDDSKCDIVEKLFHGNRTQLPAAKLLHQPNVLWYVNQDCMQ